MIFKVNVPAEEEDEEETEDAPSKDQLDEEVKRTTLDVANTPIR